MKNRLHGKMTSYCNLPILCAVCLMVAFVAPVAGVSPDEEGEPKLQASEAASAETVATKVVRVVYDPETGETISVPLRGNDVLSAPLTKALTRSTDGLQVFELASSGKGVHLDGRYQHALMVRMKPDGSIETVCTNHSHEAEQFLKGKTAEAKPTPRDK